MLFWDPTTCQNLQIFFNPPKTCQKAQLYFLDYVFSREPTPKRVKKYNCTYDDEMFISYQDFLKRPMDSKQCGQVTTYVGQWNQCNGVT